MGQQHKNETLEQQRKARQEFLELKKMQHGEMDTGPKPSEIAIVPKTPAEKIKNIWFHDKWYIIGIAALVIVVAFMVAQCATREKYDLKVVVYTYTPVADNSNELIAEYLEQYCGDIDGDGKANIQVINCSFSKESGDVQYQNTMASKLQAVLAADADALLYITDEESYEYLNGISDSGSIFENEPLKLGEKFYEKCNGEDSFFVLPEGLQISCRAVGGTVIEKNSKIVDYLEQSHAIMEGIANE